MLSLIIPTYNEAATIGILIDQIQENLKNIKHEIIVVDDNSTDGTKEIVKSKQVTLLEHKEQTIGDVSPALKIVRGDIIVRMDADLENDPADLLKLIAPIQQGTAEGKADLVLGRRPRFSRLIEHFLHWRYCRRYKLPVKDLFTGYLAFSRTLLPYAQKLAPTPLYWELPLLALALNFKVEEVNVSFPPRKDKSRIGGEIKGGIYSYTLFRNAVKKVEAITRKPLFHRITGKPPSPLHHKS